MSSTPQWDGLASELRTAEAPLNIVYMLAGFCDFLNQHVGGHHYWDAFSPGTLLKARERGRRVLDGQARTGTLYPPGLAGVVAGGYCRCDTCGGHFSIPGSSLVCGACSLRGCTH